MSTERSINPPAWQSTWHRALGLIGRKCFPCECKAYQHPYLQTIGLHAAEVAFSGVAWFVAVMWLNSIGGPQLGLTLAMETGTLVMFATLFLLALSVATDDPQWKVPRIDVLRIGDMGDSMMASDKAISCAIVSAGGSSSTMSPFRFHSHGRASDAICVGETA
jgi:hypothetical protein